MIPSEPLEVPRVDGGAAGAPGGIRFGRASPAVGARWTVTTVAHSSSVFVDAQGPDQQVSEYVSEYAAEVLALAGPFPGGGMAPGRVRVTFHKNVQRYQHADRPTAIDGKTYVVDGDAPPVRDASGAAVSSEETERVLDVFPDLGTRPAIDQVLPDAAMRIGEERHEVAGAVLSVIHPRAWTLHDGRAVLERASGPDGEAVFAVAITATSKNGVQMTVKGHAFIRLRDSRLVRLEVRGTYLPPGGAGDAGGEGSFRLERTVRDS